MLLELMSDGTLVELPPESAPIELNGEIFGDSSVVLLLPHNKYLLGNGSQWFFAKNGDKARNISLYDNEGISLLNEGSEPTTLNAETVSELRKKSLSISQPPGNHTATVLMLRSFMRNEAVFTSEGAEYLDERFFCDEILARPGNDILKKAYWALRFAMNRGELEAVSRIKAWVKAGPELFSRFDHEMKLWFSILETPDEEIFSELETLSFSRLEVQRMAAQNASPIVVYNPASGWLVLGRFGRQRETMFFLWAYYNHALWNELRERKKLSINDIIHASWGEYETIAAMRERAMYKGG